MRLWSTRQSSGALCFSQEIGLNFSQCPACGAQILDDIPHACVGDMNVPEISIPPSFFIEMPEEEWEQLLNDHGRLTTTQVERLFRMMRVPEARMPNVKLIKIVLPKGQLAKMEIYREQARIVAKSGSKLRTVKHMTVH